MKSLLKLILPVIGRKKVIAYFILGLIAGFSNFLFVTMVTKVIGVIMADNLGGVVKEYGIIFSLVILVYTWSRRELSLTSTGLSLSISRLLRKQILSQVLQAPYSKLCSRIDRIQASVINDIGALTNASIGIINFFLSAIMSVSCLVFLATISATLFAITLSVAVVGCTIYYLTSKANVGSLEKSRMLENEFQRNLNSVLNGFKEIYMDPRKGKYIYEKRIVPNVDESYLHNITALTGYINNQTIGQTLFYILITAVLLYSGNSLHITPAHIVTYVFTLLYFSGSVESIMVQLPVLMRARVSSAKLLELKKELQEMVVADVVPENNGFGDRFGQLAIKDLSFSHGPGSGNFRVGPLGMTIVKREIIFVYGGNGSGKTTALYTLLGLWPPDSGETYLNGVLVTTGNHVAYKAHFAAVFSDFYLFDEILVPDIFRKEKWQYYARLFELEDKVTLVDNRLSTRDLSTGQRKRLALILALLENKPMLVLDEWAADQDPHFKRRFYTELLPLLNKEGLTIIAITHDDRYYDCADRLFRMEEGKLFEEAIITRTGAASKEEEMSSI